MIYKSLIVNKEVNEKVLSFYKKNHLPNAFLFYGNEGIGKEAHAIEFFSFMNCKSPNLDSACGECSSCKKVKLLQHELLSITVPLPRSKTYKKNSSVINCLSSKDRENLILQFEEKGQKPYSKIKLDKANTIILNSIKDIRNNINLSIPKDSVKVHLILEAEKLCYPNKESANALLKILEEPKKNNLFILVTSDISKIIDTILSRCTLLFFPNIKKEKIKKHLLDKNIDKNKAEIISKLCFGNIRKASELINSFDVEINIVENLILSIINKDLKKWQSNFHNMDKEDILNMFNFLIVFFRDLKNYSVNKIICYDNFENYYKKITLEYPNHIWLECLTSINNSYNYILRNGYSKLIILSLFIEISSLFKNKNFDNFKLNEWITQ